MALTEDRSAAPITESRLGFESPFRSCSVGISAENGQRGAACGHVKLGHDGPTSTQPVLHQWSGSVQTQYALHGNAGCR